MSRGEYEVRLPDFLSWRLTLGAFLAALAAPLFLATAALMLSEGLEGTVGAVTAEATAVPPLSVCLAERLR